MPSLSFGIKKEMEQAMDSIQEVQEIQVMQQNSNQSFSFMQRAGEWITLLFDNLILILVEFAADDNRWDPED